MNRISNTGRIIGLISIKGGVGKTTSVVSLGHSLAKDFGKKVLVVDGNLTAPSLGMHAGVYNPKITLHDVLENKARVQEAVQATSFGFDMIPGSLENRKIKISAFKLSEKLRELRKRYDFILIDSSPNLNDELLAAMIASDELLAVTTPDYITLAATLRAVKAAKDKRSPITGLIVNKAYNKGFELNIDQIEELSGINVLALVPHEEKVMEALSLSVPATSYDKSEASLEFKKLAAALAGKNYGDKNLMTGLFSRFLGNVPKQEINRNLLKIDRIKSGIA